MIIFKKRTAIFYWFVHSEIRGGTLGHTIKDFLLSMSCLWHTNCVANPWDSKINPFNMYGANTNNIIITATNMNITCVVVMNVRHTKKNDVIFANPSKGLICLIINSAQMNQDIFHWDVLWVSLSKGVNAVICQCCQLFIVDDILIIIETFHFINSYLMFRFVHLNIK